MMFRTGHFIQRLLFTCLVLLCEFSFAQDIVKEVHSIRFTHPDSALKLGATHVKDPAIHDSIKQKILQVMGDASWHKGDFNQALLHYQSALETSKKLDHHEGIAKSLANIGYVHMEMGTYDKAVSFFRQSLEYSEKHNLKRRYFLSTVYLGVVYSRTRQFDKALKLQREAIAKMRDEKDSLSLAILLNNLGGTFIRLEQNDSALYYLNAAITIDELLGNKKEASVSRVNMSDVLYQEGRYKESIAMLNQAIPVFEEQRNSSNLSLSYGTLAKNYAQLGDKKFAEMYINKAIVFAEESESSEFRMQVYQQASELYKAIGDYPEALQFMEKSVVMRDTLYRQESAKKIAEMEARYEVNKKQKEIELLNKDKLLQDATIRRQSFQRNTVIIVSVLILLFCFFIVNRLLVTRRQKKIIEDQKQLVEYQKEQVEEKNREILDSIIYAKRLQDAILPPDTLLKKYLPHSFIFYRPKDIVAGDFYWMEVVKNGSGRNIVLFAVADCTGHGVPGALVSVVCSNALNRTVKEFRITETGKILDKVRELVLETFEKSEKEVKDGMDISLIAIEDVGERCHVQYSGANNPLWYVEDGVMKELSPSKQPIGYTDTPKPFQTMDLVLKKDTMIFLFTDGYADQFGGPKGKKFKYKPLMQNLLRVSAMPVEQQKLEMEKVFNDYKGDHEQVDDVCLAGISI